MDGTKLSIDADKFEKVQEILRKPSSDRLTVVGGKNAGINPGETRDWVKHCYMDGSYGKCVGREPGDSVFVELGEAKIDKDAIKKLAEEKGTIVEGKAKLEKTKLDAYVKELNKK